MSKKEKNQILLRGNGFIVTRSKDAYGYRLEGCMMKDQIDSFEGSMPLSQDDVAKLFTDAGLVWRYEGRAV
jgi:hypothetical protein